MCDTVTKVLTFISSCGMNLAIHRPNYLAKWAGLMKKFPATVMVTGSNSGIHFVCSMLFPIPFSVPAMILGKPKQHEQQIEKNSTTECRAARKATHTEIQKRQQNGKKKTLEKAEWKAHLKRTWK